MAHKKKPHMSKSKSCAAPKSEMHMMHEKKEHHKKEMPKKKK